ncbi:hypothetical protein GCM10009789_23530 [Kribbella sancticallisti]|uniref:Tachylectin n=1 Tax=Kribbella sancticallisti TaxID=460087 RepID=A0ABN2D568_9ACTN
MRKTIVSVAALALAATGVVVVTSSSGAAVGDVPADCSAFTSAYRTDGQRLSYQFKSSKPSVSSYPGDKLAWIPTAHQQMGGSGSTDSFSSTEFATHPTDGYLYLLSRQGVRTDGVWKMTKNTATRLKTGFGNTRILAYGYPYLYRVTGTSLYRYTVNASTGMPSAAVKLPGTRWDTVNTLIYERTGGTGAAAVDVLLGTKTNGELKEWRVNRATPTSSIGSTVLRTVGWASFSSLSTGYCQNHPNGRPLLAITAAGAASIHFDANAKDWNGTDIKGGSLGSLGWTAKAYGQ